MTGVQTCALPISPDSKTPPPPQVVAPPPLVRMNTTPPPMVVTPVISPVIITPRAVEAPPRPPSPPQPVRVQPARAKANLASYVSNDDYPESAIRNGEQGTTGFRLEVGPDGRVTNCSITNSSGSSALDTTTCRLMRSRARFTPATDSSGGKTSDSYSATIRWVLPPE